MSDKNPEWKHPELIDGEVFLCNSNVRDFYSLGYKSKRWGIQSYDIFNGPIRGNGSYPGIYLVFVDNKEYDIVMGKI